MQEVSQALNEVKSLYHKVLGRPAPEIEPGAFVAFPPGVDPRDHAVHEVQHLRQLCEQIAMSPRPVAWVPAADCYASKDTFVIRLWVPGIDRKELKVFVSGGHCLVRGERKQPELFAEMKVVALEQPWGAFERRFPLPTGCVADKLSARYENGILEVRVPIEEREIVKETSVEVV
jgi:HSP20 family protein